MQLRAFLKCNELNISKNTFLNIHNCAYIRSLFVNPLKYVIINSYKSGCGTPKPSFYKHITFEVSVQINEALLYNKK